MASNYELDSDQHGNIKDERSKWSRNREGCRLRCPRSMSSSEARTLVGTGVVRSMGLLIVELCGPQSLFLNSGLSYRRWALCTYLLVQIIYLR